MTAVKFFLLSALCFLLWLKPAQAAGGACPSGVPVTGNNCYFIAADGSDSNTGTDEQHPWLHAPGMPNCGGTGSSSCAAVQTALGPAGTSDPGIGFILRGGDTWHFGNSAPSDGMPYTGGAWSNIWKGSGATFNGAYGSVNCDWDGTTSGCLYFGVDAAWYNPSVCGSSWCRPVLNGDNPTCGGVNNAPCAVSEPGGWTYVSSCTYPIAANSNNPNFANSIFVSMADNLSIYIEGFEFTGLCSAQGGNAGAAYILTGDDGAGPASGSYIYKNIYLHGWTATPGDYDDETYCTLITGGYNLRQSYIHMVLDGSDSNATECNMQGGFFNVIGSMFTNISNMSGSECHNIHDNIWDHIAYIQPGVVAHMNVLECNSDYGDSGRFAPGLTGNTANVFYNNIVRHSNSNVDLWFCPNIVPEYWYNNVFYDTPGEGWSVAGAPTYPGCTNTGGQFMFNNTFVDAFPHPCHLGGSDVTGGQYLSVYNEHLINTPFDGTGCIGGPGSATNISMTDAQATAQGYTTGSAGTYFSNTCANDSTTPCAPTASSDATVGVGANQQDYCAQLAGYSLDYSIATEAANACQYGTTAACAYNTLTHTMVCPEQTPAARPAGVWDAGAYQYCRGSACSQPPPPLPPPPGSNPPTVNTGAADLSSVLIYPNPWRSDKHAGKSMVFAQLPADCTIKLFTVSGHKVKEFDNVNGSQTWDLTNDSGDKAGSGIYLYLITDGQGNQRRGKIGIIR